MKPILQKWRLISETRERFSEILPAVQSQYCTHFHKVTLKQHLLWVDLRNSCKIIEILKFLFQPNRTKNKWEQKNAQTVGQLDWVSKLWIRRNLQQQLPMAILGDYLYGTPCIITKKIAQTTRHELLQKLRFGIRSCRCLACAIRITFLIRLNFLPWSQGPHISRGCLIASKSYIAIPFFFWQLGCLSSSP
jgi:hypothetical protein